MVRRKSVRSARGRALGSTAKLHRACVENLEGRLLLAADNRLGVLVGQPVTHYDTSGVLSYDATSGLLKVDNAKPNFTTFRGGVLDFDNTGLYLNPDSDVHIEIYLNSSGGVVGGALGADFVLRGVVTDPNGTPGNTSDDITYPSDGNPGVLIQGEILEFGWFNQTATDSFFDFRFKVDDTTPGAFGTLFAGKDIGVTLTSLGSNFADSFAQDFQGGANGDVGPTEGQVGSISGKKVEDLDGDGVIDPGEPPLEGFTINLFRDTNGNGTFEPGDDDPAGTTMTASDGTYSFSDLEPDTYFVQEVVPANYVQTAPTGDGLYVVDVTAGNNSGNRDFANFKKFKITGTKYNDKTGNGITGDDSGQGGFTINLFKDDGDGVLDAGDGTPIQDVTDANGAYEFTGLGPGTYFVQEVGQAAWIRTVPASPAPDYYTVPSGMSGQDLPGGNFANFQKFKISGKKVDDRTGDGVTGDDSPLGNVTIKLFKDSTTTGTTGAFDATDPQVGMTTTAPDGTWSIIDLGPGTYFVQEVVPAGYVPTAPNPSTYIVSGMSGTDVGNLNFANFKKFMISGKKVKDKTGNGVSGDDSAFGGVTIKLFKDTAGGTAGVLDANDAQVGMTTTAADGSYSFSDLGPGIYFVLEMVPGGWEQTGPPGGSYTVSGMSGSNVTYRDFANFNLICLSGKKYRDCTGNGITYDDTAFGGVTINLYKDANNNGTLETGAGGDTFVRSTTTASDGTYSFTNLGHGTYFVNETTPAGYSQTAPSSGYYKVIAYSGVNVGYLNFANFQQPQVGKIVGYKYKDLCGDGLTSDDCGFGGVTIRLYRDVDGNGQLTSADGSSIASTTTASNGSYSFMNLALGKYLVQEVVPTNWVRTAPTMVDYYAVNVNTASQFGPFNFANFQKDVCHVTNVKYYVNNCLVTGLGGNTHQNSVVKVTFTVPAGYTDKVSLVSYKAPGPTFDPNTASQQTIYQVVTNTYGPGTYTIQVNTPDCYYQVDFVCGCVIGKFGPAGSNIFYSQQGRLISADNDGTNQCVDYMSAKCSFWNGTNGQNLIKKFNQVNGNDPTNLGNWLGATFANLYGTTCGTNSMCGKKNSQVAAYFKTLYAAGSSKATETQVFATALNIYASTMNLGGTAATTYGFAVTTAGLGAAQFNVLVNGGAFGVVNNTTMTVKNLLIGVNNKAINGVLYSGMSNATTLKSQANSVLSDVNQYGDIV